MMTDPIREQLLKVDAACKNGTPVDPTRLAAKAKHAANRRVARRRAGAILAFVCIAMFIANFAILESENEDPFSALASDQGSSTVDKQAEIESLKAEVAKIRQQMNEQKAIYEAALVNAEASHQAELVALRNELKQSRQEPPNAINQTAKIILFAADRKLDRYGWVDEARRDYTFVVDSFPNTPAAKIANDRLITLQNPQL